MGPSHSDSEPFEVGRFQIRELRKGDKLAGLRTKDLIHEGHKF